MSCKSVEVECKLSVLSIHTEKVGHLGCYLSNVLWLTIVSVSN